LLRFIRRVLAGALVVSSVSAAAASATPVTVNLRVEGSTQTLYEGPVTTDARTIVTPSDPAPGHPCDVAGNGPTPPGGTQSGTPTTAVFDAANASGLAFDAEWFGSTPFGDVNDYFVSQIGTDVNQSSAPFASWGLAVDYQSVSTGGCQIAATPGMDVLWAYDFFSKAHFLKMTGPATADVGEPVTFHVVDGQDGSPIAGATVNGATTDANGDATTAFGGPGTPTVKAERADSVRSNGVTVCVHAGNDGRCGTPGATSADTPAGQTPGAPSATDSPSGAVPDLLPPEGRIDGISEGRVFAHGRGPRSLAGHVTIDPSGLQAVRIRLTRNDRGRCAYFSVRVERFVRSPCGATHGKYFKIGSDPNWSYLLPFRLPRGRYVLEVLAIDTAGNRDSTRRRGGNRIVFRVR
jgi:hypothetical protein